MTTAWTGTGTVAVAPVATTYTSRADIENRFGVTNVAKWSNLAGGTGADIDRITQAINWAQDYINAAFRPSRYAIPLTDMTDENLINWARTLAGTWLYENRGFRDDSEEGDKMQDLRDEVQADIRTFLAGQKEFGPNTQLKNSASPRGPVVIP